MKRNKLSPYDKYELLDVNTHILRIKIRMNELKSDINSEMAGIINAKESMIKYTDDVDHVKRMKNRIKGSFHYIKMVRVKLSLYLLNLKLYQNEQKKKRNDPNYSINFRKLAEQCNKHKV